LSFKVTLILRVHVNCYKGEIDPIIDEGNVYAQMMKSAGVDVVVTIYADMPHVHLSQDAIFPTECKMALAQVAAFIQE
jgi:acetyl esterase/lipase